MKLIAMDTHDFPSIFQGRRELFGKPIWIIGLSFDRDSRKLVDCVAVRFA